MRPFGGPFSGRISRVSEGKGAAREGAEGLMTDFPPKNILVPVDLSQPSIDAWRQAQALGKIFGCRLEILHVQEMGAAGLSWYSAAPPWFNPKKHEMVRDELVSRLRLFPGEATHIHMMKGSPVAAIFEMVLALPVQMVVMGTRGGSGLKRMLLGSVAERVVRESLVPVLTVCKEPRPIHSILAPVNFQDYSDSGLFYAARLAAALRAHLTALNVVTDKQQGDCAAVAMRQLMNRVTAHCPVACRTETRIISGKPEEAILAAGSRCDLTVLTAHRKKLLHDVVLGTTAEHVVRNSSTPVLTVPLERTESRYNLAMWEQTVQAVNA